MSRKIMIVEENESNLSAQKAMLGGFYEIIEASDGASALQTLLVLKTDIECVLLSLTCEDAFDFLTAKRANVQLHTIPLIAITEPGRPEDENRALALDASDVTCRSLNGALLLQRVRNLVRLRENITLRRALERDPLTGIFNRHTFARRTSRMIRKKEGGSLSASGMGH